jgi:serine protease Do
MDKRKTLWSLTIIAWLVFFSTAQAKISDLPDFKSIVESNQNSVVNISVKTNNTASTSRSFRGEMPQFPFGGPFGEEFRKYFESQPNEEFNQPMQATGSGFIISTDGYILTNAHVVKDADEIVVKLHSQSEKSAKLIGFDERTDVALLKIDARGLQPVQIGDSKQLAVGEWVLAIGSPFGFEETATQGIVSAVNRNLPSDSYVPYIQTDVAVNPGNSGGPLFNTKGEVIGINSQIFSRSGGYMGLSFAIPIDVAMDVTEQLKTNGFVERGWLGVLIQPVTQELAESFSLAKPEGALVAKIEPNSPAAKAGLKTGDVVMEFDGKAIHQTSELPYVVGTTKPGKKVPVQILRNGKMKQIFVTVETMQTEKVALNDSNESSSFASLNIIVSDISDQQREQLGLSKDAGGVFVEQVKPGSAAKAGIHSGDVILKLQDQKITNVTTFEKSVASLPTKKPVPVLIQRDGNPQFLALVV